jgi:hypothetical protein
LGSDPLLSEDVWEKVKLSSRLLGFMMNRSHESGSDPNCFGSDIEIVPLLASVFNELRMHEIMDRDGAASLLRGECSGGCPKGRGAHNQNDWVHMALEREAQANEH